MKPNFVWSHWVTKVYTNSPGHMTSIAAMPINGKNLKKSYSLEPKGWWPWSWYAALGSRVLPTLFKWWPWDDLDIFYSKVKFGPLCFCKTMDFSETIVGYDIMVGRYSQLHEDLWVPKVKVIDLGPNQSGSIFLNFFFSDFNINSALRWAIQDQWSGFIS